MLKAKSSEEALDINKKVYFVSMAAVDYNNHPFNKPRQLPSIFDVGTEQQFANTDVTFISVPKMHEMYHNEQIPAESCNEDMCNANADELLTWFLKKDPNASYFIDEYGWNSKRGECLLFYKLHKCIKI